MSNMICRAVLKRSLSLLGLAVALGSVTVSAAQAADTPVAIGISGWTGFAPLTLADKAGIFKKNGLDVTWWKPRIRWVQPIRVWCVG